MVGWRRYKFFPALAVFAALLAGSLFGDYPRSIGAPAWLQVIAREIQAACRDAGTQWMVVICLASYFIVFVVLERRILPQKGTEGTKEKHSTPHPGPFPAFPGRSSSGLQPPSPQSGEGNRDGAGFFARLVPFCGQNPDVWLIAFVSLVLLRYAVDYANVARSLQVVVLLTGIVIGKGIALWAAWNTNRGSSPIFSPSNAEKEIGAHGPNTMNKARAILAILVFLLAGASLWQPEQGMEFFYRGQQRWTGRWDNPNLYGLLMGTGLVLALGLFVSRRSRVRRRAQVESREPEERDRKHLIQPAATFSLSDAEKENPQGEGGVGLSPDEAESVGKCPTFNVQLSTRNAAHWFSLILYFCAAAPCAYGLLKSYSRGAWLATAVALGFFVWKFSNRERRELRQRENQSDLPLLTSGHPCPVRRGEGRGGGSDAHGVTYSASPVSSIWSISRFHGNWLPISVILISFLVLCFWQFRHTESPLVRRIFSVGNPNDFSWRNRVAAWQGAGRMMIDKPLFGFGWGQAEDAYSKDYHAARLEEFAAIQMNDYLMLGISAGGLALACLIAYLWLALSRERRSPLPAALATGKHGAVGVTCPTSNYQLSTIAASGAMVLLIGFWFDGGLFRLPTAVVFWVLLEITRGRFLTTKHTAHTIIGTRKQQDSTVMAINPTQDLGRAFRVICGSKKSYRSVFDSVQRRLQVRLRWLAGIAAAVALGFTVLHLGTPQLAVSERTLSIARKFLVPPQEQVDFEFLAAKQIWGDSPLKTLLQHAHLANYNRTLVNWKLDDPLYREFVLLPDIEAVQIPSPGISVTLTPPDRERAGVGDDPAVANQPSATKHRPPSNPNWRRPLWEHFYPRIRKESSLEAAAEIVIRNLAEVCRRRGNETLSPFSQHPATLSPLDEERVTGATHQAVSAKSVLEIWRQPIVSHDEFDRISVAALRSAGIPARLITSGQAEFWNGAEWKPAPRPIEVNDKR